MSRVCVAISIVGEVDKQIYPSSAFTSSFNIQLKRAEFNRQNLDVALIEIEQNEGYA